MSDERKEPTYPIASGLPWKETLAFMFTKLATVRAVITTEGGVSPDHFDRLMRAIAKETGIAPIVQGAVDAETVAESKQALEDNATRQGVFTARMQSRTQTSH